MGCNILSGKQHVRGARSVLLTFLCCAAVFAGGSQLRAEDVDKQDRLRARCVNILGEALDGEREVAKVRAAKALLWNNYYDQNIKDIFLAEQAQTGSNYQIGVWQILTQATPKKSNTKPEREKYIGKILAAFLDVKSKNSSQAAESLVKLGYSDRPETVLGIAKDGQGVRQVNALWILANSGGPEDQASLGAMLDSQDDDVRGRAAYALRHVKDVSGEIRPLLEAALLKEPVSSTNRVYFLSALYVHSSKDNGQDAEAELVKYIESGSKEQKIEALEALGEAGDESKVSFLSQLLENENADIEVRISAANAILRIERQDFRGLRWPDWAVVGLYAAFMLVIGWYYSRRQTSTEEYFLGSRSMGSFVIAISLYATLLSTISYLSVPGEIIRHGPSIIIWGVLGLPLIIVICGYALIPFFMKLPITSAYEILEGRLGIVVRLVGSVIFVITRLIWMALLIYLAAKAVVVMVGWPESTTPLVVVVAGVIAVLYTAMGGLRAVVITDVVQFFVLLAGAIITAIFVSIDIGFGAWFPTSWAPHWDTVPFFSWNPVVRVTIIGSIVSGATWTIFTYGSDQVAIQRYLATRDAKAARRALYINCLVSLVISGALAFVGFSVLGFFRNNPQAIADGKNLLANADFLFPHYIANYLPVGVAGLVIAAMFAAAMSSLDSGINSIVTVFYTDFLSRFRKGSGTREHNVKLAKYLVLGIGTVVVLLSAPVGNIPGNITEVTSKTNGLFVAPLFGLFFMCLFVRFSTPFGAIVGALYGFAFAFIWAFWDVLTGGPMLSFQWISLFPFVVHVVVGSLVSLLPTRGKSWPVMILWTVAALAPIAVCFLLITQ